MYRIQENLQVKTLLFLVWLLKFSNFSDGMFVGGTGEPLLIGFALDRPRSHKIKKRSRTKLHNDIFPVLDNIMFHVGEK